MPMMGIRAEHAPSPAAATASRTARKEGGMAQQRQEQPAGEVCGGKEPTGREREKPLVKDLNEHIVCPLCRGYLIDATTLVECLHSFCRGCIVRRLNGGPRTCPVCSASALAPLVPDIGLQRLVYLVVPSLFRTEQERRRHFQQDNPQCANLNQPPIGAPELSFDELVSLSLCELEAKSSEGSTRYLKCPAGVTVRHLLRLLMLKRGWDDTDETYRNSKIEMLYEVRGSKNDMEVLDPSWTLMDLACIFEWKREAPMKLLYRIIRVDELPTKQTSSNCDNSLSLSNSSSLDSGNNDANNQAIENIQRPPTPPPSPKPAISRTTPATTVVDQYSKDLKPRCEVTPVMRAPDPPIDDKRKLSKLEHPHKRKKRRNKRVIAEITTTPREDLLKLKVRLTPVPARVTSSTSGGSQTKDKLLQMRTARKEKTKSGHSQKHKPPKERKMIEDEKSLSERKEFTVVQEAVIVPDKLVEVSEKSSEPVAPPESSTPEKEESPKNEEVLRRLGLVAIAEANKSKQERNKSPAQSATDKSDPAVEREKLEKQLRESKANRVRSLLAEKQMRDTLKSIMSSSQEVVAAASPTPSSNSASSTSRSGTPTTNSVKRKEPPPLTPLRSAKRPNVTFSLNTFTIGKHDSPLDLSSAKDKVLDLSSGVSDVVLNKGNSEEKQPVGILRNNRPQPVKEEQQVRKTQDTNLRTLSDAAVSLLSDRSIVQLDKSKLSQNFIGVPGPGGSTVAGKVALRVPQPHQRISNFGLKIKPNIGVRHIPNPQAVVASQYRNQRTGYYNVNHQPP